MDREPPSPARRRALLAAGAAALLAAGAAAAWFATRPRVPRHNIVLVVWDTCRADRLSAGGYARPTTPFLTSWTSRGTLYRSAFSATCWTPPAHASLFTGLLPRNHGLRESRSDRLLPGVELLPKTLRAEGYETAAFVANPFLSSITGLVKDFEFVAPCYMGAEGKGTGTEVRAALDAWLGARRARGETRPLFLFVNLMESHLPYAASPVDLAEVVPAEARWAARDASERVNQGAAFAHIFGVDPLSPETIRALGDAYDASVRGLDRATEGILGRLEKEGLLEGAVLAVAGDHGEHLGEGGALDHVMSPHDPVLHVPLFLRWPGRIAEGRVEDAQVRLHDLYPVLIEAAGAEAPEANGRDALSLLETPLRPRTVFAEFGPVKDFLVNIRKEMKDAPEEAFRRMDFSYVVVREPPGPGSRKVVAWTLHPKSGPARPESMESYDTAADPGEQRDLLEDGAAGPEREKAEALVRLASQRHPPAR